MLIIRNGEWIINYVNSYPRELMIEITTNCNYNCIYCFRNTILDPEIGKHMDYYLFKHLIKQAYNAKISKISLSGWGEPLTHPMIIDFISELKRYGFKILINTNGYLLSEYIKELYELGVDIIHISIDSISEELYQSIRTGGDISKINESLMKLKELKLKNSSFKPEIHIQFTLTTLNIEELINLPEYIKKIAASQATISNIIPLNKEMEDKLSIYKNVKYMKIIEDLKDKLAKRVFEAGGRIILPNFTNISDRKCPFISVNAAFIRYDGEVSPCIEYAHNWKVSFMGVTRTIRKIVFGNILKEELIEIWRKPEYIKFRFNTFFFRMPSCYECKLKDYCNLTITNEYDCWGNHPSCASCPYSHGIVNCPL